MSTPIPINEILQGDVLDRLRTLPDKSVNCVVTSPPYWGLRDYGVDGQLGLEKTPEEFISKLVAIFREVRRVLRDEGTCWVNLGDSYWGGKGQSAQAWSTENTDRDTLQKPYHQISGMKETRPSDRKHDVIKPKDLVGIPWRFALAAQADGWYLRSAIPWVKRNAMPESAKDRPTTAVEYVFLLTKSSKYFYDNEAIKVPSSETNADRPRMGQGTDTQYNQKRAGVNSRIYQDRDPDHSEDRKNRDEKPGNGKRSRRNSDWFFESWQGLYSEEDDEPLAFIINLSPYKEAHFATFPEKLVEPCILAGCPKEVCPKCGKARTRVVNTKNTGSDNTRPNNNMPGGEGNGFTRQRAGDVSSTTLGWSDCGCNAGFVPGLVLDPFIGSGTTGLVAAKNERSFLGIELKPKYIDLAYNRLIKGIEKHLYGKPKKPKAVKEAV